MEEIKIDLSVNLGSIKLKNPIMPASGTFGYGIEFSQFYDLSNLGAIIPKSLSLKAKEGAPPRRIIEVEGGMINAIGLENIGIERFLKEIMPKLKEYKTAIIVNIFGSSEEEFIELARIINEDGRADAIELNISCPNVREGGIFFGSNAKLTYNLIKKVKRNSQIPIIAKLTPNDCNIVEIAKASEDAGADAISLINSILAFSIDIDKKEPKLGLGFGGLSGSCIKPIALRMVYQVAKNTSLPVIGIGGIKSIEDVIEFLMAGATAVQIGTFNFIDPLICYDLVKQLYSYCVDKKIYTLASIIGIV